MRKKKGEKKKEFHLSLFTHLFPFPPDLLRFLILLFSFLILFFSNYNLSLSPMGNQRQGISSSSILSKQTKRRRSLVLLQLRLKN